MAFWSILNSHDASSRRVFFTGGGSAGHVTPNLALIAECKKQGWEVVYVGSECGLEKEIISRENIPYYSVAVGKLRRYFSWQNVIDPVKVLWGIVQAFLLVWRLKPNVVFSKGGFVAFPVVFGAWLNQIPVVVHESDLTPGLANKLSFPFARKICVTFEETKQYFKNQRKIVVTGTPIRSELFSGDAKIGRNRCGFHEEKPIILVVGGGFGSTRINKTVREILPNLLACYQVVHLCGKEKCDAGLEKMEGYKQFEYLHDDYAHVLAAADLVISRSGANALYELLALYKPHILIPLSQQSSRGDQVHNANYFQQRGVSYVIFEEQLTGDVLMAMITQVMQHREEIKKKLQTFHITNGVEKIYSVLTQV